VVPGPWFGP